MADAIRLGNGMGSVDRRGGVSGYPREDESCRYWTQHLTPPTVWAPATNAPVFEGGRWRVDLSLPSESARFCRLQGH